MVDSTQQLVCEEEARQDKELSNLLYLRSKTFSSTAVSDAQMHATATSAEANVTSQMGCCRVGASTLTVPLVQPDMRKMHAAAPHQEPCQHHVLNAVLVEDEPQVGAGKAAQA